MGHRTVPIEIGHSYLATDARQKLMTVKRFISKYILNDAASAGKRIREERQNLPQGSSEFAHEVERADTLLGKRKLMHESGEITPDGNSLRSSTIGYLAQHRLVRPYFSS